MVNQQYKYNIIMALIPNNSRSNWYGIKILLMVIFSGLIITLLAISAIYSFTPLRKAFHAVRSPCNFSGGSIFHRDGKYSCIGNFTSSPSSNRATCKKTLNPLRSVCTLDEHYSTADGPGLRRSITRFIFVPGHLSSNGEPCNFYRFLGMTLREYGHREEYFYRVYYAEDPTAFAESLSRNQANFLIESIKAIYQKEVINEDDQFVVIGSSFGGAIATLASTQEPAVFKQVKALITLSSPLNTHPMPTSLASERIYGQMLKKSDLLAPLIQVYAGQNDFLVDVRNSKIDRYENSHKYYQYLPAMKNVFADMTHVETFYGRITSQAIGAVIGEYFGKTQDENLVDFWKRKTTLVPFNIDTTLIKTLLENPGFHNVYELGKGTKLVGEEYLKDKDEIVYKIDAQVFRQSDEPYVFVTTVPAQTIELIYEDELTGHFFQQQDYEFDFKMPLSYKAIPISGSLINDAKHIFIKLKEIELVTQFSPQKELTYHEEYSFYIGLLPYTKCVANINYGNIILGYHVDFLAKECFHYFINIDTSISADFTTFTVYMNTIEKLKENIRYATLVLLKQDGAYRNVDFYMHSNSIKEQSIAELPYPGFQTISLEFFGLDHSIFKYKVELSINLLYYSNMLKKGW